MSLTPTPTATPMAIKRYPIRQGQNGPKSSPQAVEIMNPHPTGLDEYTPIVTRQSDGEWTPVSNLEDVARLVRDSSQPDSNVQIGTWVDKERGNWFRKRADNEVQNDEVTSMHDRLGWKWEIVVDNSSGGLDDAAARPQEAKLTSHEGSRAALTIPYYAV